MTAKQCRDRFGDEGAQDLIDAGCLVITADWKLVKHPQCTHLEGFGG